MRVSRLHLAALLARFSSDSPKGPLPAIVTFCFPALYSLLTGSFQPQGVGWNAEENPVEPRKGRNRRRGRKAVARKPIFRVFSPPFLWGRSRGFNLVSEGRG